MIAGGLLSKLLRNVLVEKQLHIFNSNITFYSFEDGTYTHKEWIGTLTYDATDDIVRQMDSLDFVTPRYIWVLNG